MLSAQQFWDKNPEDGDHNQYWYSNNTINRIIEDQIEQLTLPDGPADGRISVFLSTPSLYFTLPDHIRKKCFVFDYDRKWENDRGFVFYDFNKPLDVPESLLGKCDMLVIDPPFIVHDVWKKYAQTAKLLLKSGFDKTGNPLGKVVLTTVRENADLLNELFGVTPTAFQPSIPHLVYQYDLYTNYNSSTFSKLNPEIPV